MKPAEAQRVIEQLRMGIPPAGYTKHFTVGRIHEIQKLETSLHGNGAPVLLLQANFGSGKSHLLRYIRDHALSQNFAVSFVTLDAQSGVRFNRMDQIMGAILRNIEIPPHLGPAGLASTLNVLRRACEVAREKPGNVNGFWKDLTNGWKWDFSEKLESAPMFVAIRAWCKGDKSVQDLVIDWLQEPENYRSQRGQLYTKLVEGMRMHFRDPRPDWQFYADNVLSFHTDGYRAVWDGLRDMNELLVESGLRGLIVLFDEFEDVLTGLTNVQWKEAAFWNLFLFMGGQRFPGRTFYAVTPDFVGKCKKQLMDRGRLDFDYERFDELPSFEMSPLTKPELTELAGRILNAHACAFGYQPEDVDPSEIRDLIAHLSRSPVQDRARHTIREVVKLLDTLLEYS
jgi:hypothetical protein